MQVTQNVWRLSLIQPRLFKPWSLVYDINFNFQSWTTGLRNEEADICLYGRLCMCQNLDGKQTLFLNPGSISQPRGTVRECLMLVWRLMIVIFQSGPFWTRDHEGESGLSKEF